MCEWSGKIYINIFFDKETFLLEKSQIFKNNFFVVKINNTVFFLVDFFFLNFCRPLGTIFFETFGCPLNFFCANMITGFLINMQAQRVSTYIRVTSSGVIFLIFDFIPTFFFFWKKFCCSNFFTYNNKILKNSLVFFTPPFSFFCF